MFFKRVNKNSKQAVGRVPISYFGAWTGRPLEAAGCAYGSAHSTPDSHVPLRWLKFHLFATSKSGRTV
jgi:hypothetical protein